MMFEWPVILAMVATLAAAATIWWSRRSQATSGTGRNDRYASEEVISRAQHKLYDYLQEAFPGQVVLYAQPLSRLVSVRFAENRQRAQQRLQDHVVDFVVCSADGKPQFAFQVDAYRADDAEAARRDAAVKHRVLATAGIRLLRLKKSVRHLPEPAEFGARLLNVLPGAAADSDAAALSGSPQRPSRVPVLTQEVRMGRGGRLESESMSLTGLMGLAQTQR